MKKLLRVITVILVAVILIANHPLSVKAADKTVHQFFGEAEDNRNSIYYYDDVRSRLDILQRDYFQCNRYWNHIGAAPGTDAVSLQYMVTDTACTHAATAVGPYCNHYTGNYGGSQCMGFAKLMCKGIFGTDPWDADWSYGSIDNLYVGDYVRINSIPHSFVIERIHEDSVDVYECNWNARCQINTRNIPMSTLRNYRFTASDSGNYIRHCNRNRSDIPGSNLSGSSHSTESLCSVKIYYNGELWKTESVQSGSSLPYSYYDYQDQLEAEGKFAHLDGFWYSDAKGTATCDPTIITSDMNLYVFSQLTAYGYYVGPDGTQKGLGQMSLFVRYGERFKSSKLGDASQYLYDTPEGEFDGYYIDSSCNTKLDDAPDDFFFRDGDYRIYLKYVDNSLPKYPNFDEFVAPKGCVYQFRLYNPNSGEHFYTGSKEETVNLVKAGWNFEGSGFITPTVGIPIYRLYSAEHGDHFYTTDVSERDALLADNWTLDGDTGIAFPSAPAETGRPMYRLYNPNAYPNGEAGAHHFTMSWEEVENLQAEGWQYEFIAWYSV